MSPTYISKENHRFEMLVQALNLVTFPGRMYSWCTRRCIFPLLALVPPVAVALATDSLELLVGITGSYAGEPAGNSFKRLFCNVYSKNAGTRNCSLFVAKVHFFPHKELEEIEFISAFLPQK